MNFRLYLWAARLLVVVLVVTACHSNNSAGTNTRSADTIDMTPADNTRAVDRPAGDSNAAVKDSVYNRDSSKRK